MMTTVAATLADLLSRAPDPLLAADRIGARRPSTSSNVPAISIGVEIADGGARWTPDPRGEGLSGTVALEIWAMTAAEAESVAQKLERRLRDLRSQFREKGFLQLRAHALHPAEVVSYQPLAGSPLTSIGSCAHSALYSRHHRSRTSSKAVRSRRSTSGCSRRPAKS